MASDPVPREAKEAVELIRQCFPDALVAAYLHGSAVAGGLRRHSDVDILAVVDRPTTHAERAHLLDALMAISGRPGHRDAPCPLPRPLEVIIFHEADVRHPVHPARSEFIYGEWLRDAFLAGAVPEPASDPELTLVLAQARHEAMPLYGPSPEDLLPEISEKQIRRAIGDVMPALLGALEGDERNVLLTLVRMWRTLTAGDFVSKDAAADWAMPLLPAKAAALIRQARLEYLGLGDADWTSSRQEVRRVADDLATRVTARL